MLTWSLLCFVLSVRVTVFLLVIEQITHIWSYYMLCSAFSSSFSLQPWLLDTCLLSHHYEWCRVGYSGCCGFPLGPLPPPALWRFAEAAANGSVGYFTGLVPLLPYCLHPAIWCQHGMTQLQLLEKCIFCWTNRLWVTCVFRNNVWLNQVQLCILLSLRHSAWTIVMCWIASGVCLTV